MLKFRNLNGVLAQSVENQNQDGIDSSIISSILVTPSGDPVAAYHHSSQVPLYSSNISLETNMEQEQNHEISKAETPYHVDRCMRTKVFGLLASSTWDEYSRGCILPWKSSPDAADMGNEDVRYKWISVLTEDSLLVIRPIKLHTAGEYLLSIMVTESNAALGVICKKSEELVKILEVGLKEYKLYE